MIMTEPMYIDGTPLSEYGAKLLDWKPGAPSLDNTISPGKSYAFPRLLRSEVTPKPLAATVDVIGTDYADSMNKASALILAVNKTTELYMPDGYYYRSALSGVSEIDWSTPWIAELTLTFQSVQHADLVEINVPRNNYPIRYLGTAPAGYKMEFTAPNDIQNITLSIYKDVATIIGSNIILNGVKSTSKLLGLTVNGKTTETGTGAQSPTNPFTLTGTSKVTVNSTDYTIPDLYSLPDGICDTYEIVGGSGIKSTGKAIVNGTTALSDGALVGGGVYTQFAVNLPDLKLSSGANVYCTHFASTTDPANNSCGGWTASTYVFFRILNATTNITADDNTTALRLAKIKTWLTANPVTVIYPLATPTAITGTPQSIALKSPLTVIKANNANLKITYALSGSDDFQITSIPANVTVTIDGIEKTVTQNGINKFAETNIVDFPVFDPQAPDMLISMSQYVPLKISYYPTFM